MSRTTAENLFFVFVMILALFAILTIVPGWGVIIGWLSKDLAPAWVQAVGSVLAIVGAAAVASWQVGRAERGAEILRNQVFAAKVLAIAGILKSTEFPLNFAIQACETSPNQLWSLALGDMERAITTLERIPIFELPNDALVYEVVKLTQIYKVAFIAAREFSVASVNAFSEENTKGSINAVLKRLETARRVCHKVAQSLEVPPSILNDYAVEDLLNVPSP